MLYYLDLFGTVVFAFSGCLIAGQKRMDLFGVIVLALVTAIGGGTLRDLILGAEHVFWVDQPIYIQLCVATAVLTFYAARKHHFEHSALKYADALGLAVFTIVGTEKALSYGASPTIALMMGVMTGVMGGIIRDVLSGEIPMVLRREIYAAASLLGALVYISLHYIYAHTASIMIIAAAVTLSLRILAIRKNLALPVYNLP